LYSKYSHYKVKYIKGCLASFDKHETSHISEIVTSIKAHLWNISTKHPKDLHM